MGRLSIQQAEGRLSAKAEATTRQIQSQSTKRQRDCFVFRLKWRGALEVCVPLG